MNHKHQTKVDQKTIHNQREKKERKKKCFLQINAQ